MKKIAFYLSSNGFGGVEKVSITYIEKLCEYYDVTLIFDDEVEIGNENADFKKLKVSGMFFLKSKAISKLSLLSKSKLNFPKKIILMFIRYLIDLYVGAFKIGKIKHDFDVIIYGYQLLPIHLASKCNGKKILFFHNSIQSLDSGVRRFLGRIIEKRFSHFDSIIFPLGCSKLDFEKRYPKNNANLVVIPNPFEVVSNNISESVKPSESEYYVSCGRLDESNKDFETLIRAYADSDSQFPLYIIGDGPSRLFLTKLAYELKCSQRVKFLGFIQDPSKIISDSRAFILSSKSEGFGMVLIEAMSHHIPVISSDCPVGPREILKNGEFGTLFPVGDINTLSKIIKELDNERDFRFAATFAAYDSLSRYRLDYSFESLQELIYEKSCV
ncbi:hypothetical protein BCU90_24220 [Vibrio lentus]|uniref:glycosyltransferase n=1 Tax=Vibrio TaxID=662 RepID=UPI000C82C210|nr:MULTISPECIES: glycosyltransferase [Vibrio]MDN2667524.1 glycosyltransferase [Vibrio sp. 14N.309.X.WAT.E.F5]PMG42599.1 hypothetical protein BCU90_24220 [Vibrio lentus]